MNAWHNFGERVDTLVAEYRCKGWDDRVFARIFDELKPYIVSQVVKWRGIYDEDVVMRCITDIHDLLRNRLNKDPIERHIEKWRVLHGKETPRVFPLIVRQIRNELITIYHESLRPRDAVNQQACSFGAVEGVSHSGSVAEEIANRDYIEKLLGRIDTRTAGQIELLKDGYSYQEIGRIYGVTGVGVRLRIIAKAKRAAESLEKRKFPGKEVFG